MATPDTSVFNRLKTMQDYQRMEEEFQMKKALNQALINKAAKSASGGGDPAAVKIVNEMQAAARASSDASLSEAERAQAAHRYNLLNQVAKSYAVDRGMDVAVPSVYGQRPQDVQPRSAPPNISTEDVDRLGAEWERQQPIMPRSTPMQIPQGVTPISGHTEILAQRASKIEEEKLIGKKRGEIIGELKERESRHPQLIKLVNDLSALGKKATYTFAGRGTDVLMRELGQEPREAAVARADYISRVDNEVLPLLRQTFGAQFTQREGESLKETLGAPNKTPKEKDAVLRSFIGTKMETINSQFRELGMPERFSQAEISEVVSGIGSEPTAQPGGWKYLGTE